MKKRLLFLITFLIPFFLIGQNLSTFLKKSDSLHKKRRNALIVSESIIATGALIGLNELWYKDYPRSKFHFKNDNNDWKQMDKVGHFMTSYYLGTLGIKTLDWAGVSKKEQLIYGATIGVSFLTAIEVLDGFSEQWGASTGDVLANAAGAGFAIGQELLWKEQRISVKYSFHQTKYAQLRTNTFGDNYLQQSLKDYNGQTYWLSANIWSFSKKSKIPKWVNIALGYGAEGMLSGNENNINNIDEKPYRQFYLSLDVDLTKIKTSSKLLKSVFSVVNFIKIPAPTLEINTKNGLKFHFIYF
ncbi:DUF2279 domain-containing protein [uncultured Polaribacter sp.]|uniref:DUF2279 domain-containing protein n=1 Tax=uncultured Polaribacter sp. TaxID=174711 RepID=UPI002620CB7E|nr:DUF2279 domain-containing protein [uncultured Polaribacter sp.]